MQKINLHGVLRESYLHGAAGLIGWVSKAQKKNALTKFTY
jgi:hypothetical protein